jgi:hypothetical protein
MPRFNAAATRSYLADFERRFVETADGQAIYVRGEGGPGVRLPAAEAAALVAGMRSALAEADAATPLAGMDALPAAFFAFLMSILLGTLLGYPETGFAAALPLAVAVVLLGPLLGQLRLYVAWRRALTRAERELGRFDQLGTGEVRSLVAPNRVRPIFITVTILWIAVLAGLMLAAETSPDYARIRIDRFTAWLAMPAVISVVWLALGSHVYDLITRRRLSEADIRQAMADRRRRPLR